MEPSRDQTVLMLTYLTYRLMFSQFHSSVSLLNCENVLRSQDTCRDQCSFLHHLFNEEFAPPSHPADSSASITRARCSTAFCSVAIASGTHLARLRDLRVLHCFYRMMHHPGDGSPRPENICRTLPSLASFSRTSRARRAQYFASSSRRCPVITRAHSCFGT